MGLEKIVCNFPPAGHGKVNTSHGLLPLPVPAVLEMARKYQIPLLGGEEISSGELTTPTGIALMAILANSFDDGPDDEIALVKNYQANKLASSGNNVDVSNIEEIPAADTKPIVIQKGGDTNTASVQQKPDVYSGSLDTGIYSYHDRTAFNSAVV